MHIDPPITVDEAVERLRGVEIPEPILDVARTLSDAGHRAVLVGGAVRDALLGLPRGDWDLASSATPEEVQSLFRRTIPTGIEHGTVTILTGHGEAREVVEVTTFRGDGDYQDGRRPAAVTFLRDLALDLARRDFTVNAFAWDPVEGTFTDLFSGLADLRARMIRAVGVPLDRFREDGLRTMRAVRFCATLGFRLEPRTEAAIEGALDVFDKVSRERVRVELFKLLSTDGPSLGLRPLARTGLWPRVLGEVEGQARERAIGAVDAMGLDPVPRLARLLWPHRATPDEVDRLVCALKPSRAERGRVLALTSPATEALGAARSPAEIRRAAAKLGAAHLEDAMDVLGLCERTRDRYRATWAGSPLSAKELAIKGGDLIEAGLVSRGPEVRELVEALLDWVLEDPSRNRADLLLAHARGRERH